MTKLLPVEVHEENQRNMRKYQELIQQANLELEEEQRARDRARENMINMERRSHSLANALEEARTMLDQADRARRYTRGHFGSFTFSIIIIHKYTFVGMV